MNLKTHTITLLLCIFSMTLAPVYTQASTVDPYIDSGTIVGASTTVSTLTAKYITALALYRESLQSAANIINDELSGTAYGRVEPNNDQLRRSVYITLYRLNDRKAKLQIITDGLLQALNDSPLVAPNDIVSRIRQADPRSELNAKIYSALVSMLNAQANWYRHTDGPDGAILYRAGNYLFSSPEDDYRYHSYLGTVRGGVYSLLGYGVGYIQKLDVSALLFAPLVRADLDSIVKRFGTTIDSPCRVGYMNVHNNTALPTHCDSVLRSVADSIRSSASLTQKDSAIDTERDKLESLIQTKSPLRKSNINALYRQAVTVYKMQQDHENDITALFVLPRFRSASATGPYGAYAIYTMEKTEFATASSAVKKSAILLNAPWVVADSLLPGVRNPFTVVNSSGTIALGLQKGATIPSGPYKAGTMMWFFDRYRSSFPLLKTSKPVPIIALFDR